MAMCPWMGSHCRDCIDYNGITFSIQLLEWVALFRATFGGKKILARRCLVFGY